MSSDRLSIRIPADLRRLIEDQGRTVSEVVREALAEHVRKSRRRDSCYDVASRLGIIGSVKKAPNDLSTGRRHFRGFGV
jgi:ABC-type uncharacterized transport system YnjBCD ATPase subunit